MTSTLKNNKTNDKSKSKTSSRIIYPEKDIDIKSENLEYEKVLRENGINTEIKKYPKSKHGFIEENNPEYEKLNFKASKSPEQEIMARDAENYIRI